MLLLFKEDMSNSFEVLLFITVILSRTHRFSVEYLTNIWVLLISHSWSKDSHLVIKFTFRKNLPFDVQK